MNRKMYRIGNFCFEILCSSPLCFPTFFEQFQTENATEVSFTYEIFVTETLPIPEGKPIAMRPDLVVFGNEALESRLFFFKGANAPYGCLKELSEQHAQIWIHEAYLSLIPIDTVFGSLFALERQMLKRNALILHCSVLCHEGKAILFSGPSGIGKSTQANLWVQHAQAFVLNGDRALLQQNQGIWTANGWPICGSSEICLTDSSPIRAIVYLQQAKQNCATRLSYVQSVKKLMEQVTVNAWNKTYVDAAWTLAEQIVGQIPAFSYACNMHPDAVTTLKQALEE